MKRRDHHGSGLRPLVKRFSGVKIFASGNDPNGAFLEFLRKDVVKNIDVHRDTVKRIDDLDGRTGKVAVGCTKIFRERKEVPRVPYVLNTDHISFQMPVSQSYDQIQFKRYSKSNVSKESWQAPRALSSFSNYHSTSFNIISHQSSPMPNPKKPSGCYAGRSKGISEFHDLSRAFCPHINQDYSKALEEDPRVFYKKTGIFSHMYDAAGRHGFMIKPFERSNKCGKVFY